MINLIAAIDKNRALGKNSQLLCHLPLDLKYFKQYTLNQSLLMGRKTFESIGRALPNRENFVLSHKKNLKIPGCICVNSLAEAIAKKQCEDLWIIGGAEIYSLCLPFANKLFLTHIEHTFENADTFFPNIDLKQWKIISEKFYSISEKNTYPLRFVTYQAMHPVQRLSRNTFQ